MGRAKFLFLAAIMFTFLGVTAWSTWNYDRAFRIVTSRTQLSAWSLAQLEIELHHFEETLVLYQSGHATAETLNLNYDIAWNRLDTFINSEETRTIRSRFGAEKVTRDIFDILRKYEDNITGAKADDPKLRLMSHELEQQMIPLRDLMVQNFTGPNAIQESKLLLQSKTQNLTAIAILLLVGLAMLATLFREAKRQHFLAWNDQLTGLPNRAAFIDKVTTLLARPDTHAVLCLLDLNRFKEVNDSFGHAAGDRLLIMLAEQLKPFVQEGVYVARIGSDEFALLMHGKLSEEDWFPLSRQVFNQLDRLLYNEDSAHRVRLNMGISQFPLHARDTAELVLFADLALLSAKQHKQLHYQVFNRFMLDQYQRRRMLAGQLREHLQVENNPGIFIQYQPIINHSHPERLGTELLIRWNHETLEFINPLHIIEIAEENGLAELLGEWIFRRMGQDMRYFPRNIIDKIDVSINLSAAMFNQNLADNAVNWLEGSPITPSQLVLELTESIALEDLQLSRTIFYQLREKHIRIALDDFGTGWSSFSYLKDLNFSKLKIDKSFVQDIDKDHRLPLFVNAITDLSHKLGVSVVAEGVETANELDTVLAIGADEIQGYLYSRPLRVDAFLEFAANYFSQRQKAEAGINFSSVTSPQGPQA